MCGYRYEPHKGLVDAYIAMQRFRDASTIATHACKKLGETPRVLTVRQYDMSDLGSEMLQRYIMYIYKNAL